MKRKLNYGDIFSLEVAKDKYVFGRVLFDVNEQYEAYYKEYLPDYNPNEYSLEIKQKHIFEIKSSKILEATMGLVESLHSNYIYTLKFSLKEILLNT